MAPVELESPVPAAAPITSQERAAALATLTRFGALDLAGMLLGADDGDDEGV